MITVKICGLTTYEDAFFAAQAGADMLGFNFFKRSPRYLEVAPATEICDRLRRELGEQCPLLVGVFVNETVGTISAVTNTVGLNAAQLSGDESNEMLAELRGIAFKSIRPMNRTMALEDAKYYESMFPKNEKLPSLLLDAHHPGLYGGTGQQASDEVAVTVREMVPRLMLAGGLHADTVAQRIRVVQPWGVDVASGVEPEGQPGVKDHAMVQAFIEAVRFA